MSKPAKLHLHADVFAGLGAFVKTPEGASFMEWATREIKRVVDTDDMTATGYACAFVPWGAALYAAWLNGQVHQ